MPKICLLNECNSMHCSISMYYCCVWTVSIDQYGKDSVCPVSHWIYPNSEIGNGCNAVIGIYGLSSAMTEVAKFEETHQLSDKTWNDSYVSGRPSNDDCRAEAERIDELLNQREQSGSLPVASIRKEDDDSATGFIADFKTPCHLPTMVHLEEYTHEGYGPAQMNNRPVFYLPIRANESVGFHFIKIVRSGYIGKARHEIPCAVAEVRGPTHLSPDLKQTKYVLLKFPDPKIVKGGPEAVHPLIVPRPGGEGTGMELLEQRLEAEYAHQSWKPATNPKHSSIVFASMYWHHWNNPKSARKYAIKIKGKNLLVDSVWLNPYKHERDCSNFIKAFLELLTNGRVKNNSLWWKMLMMPGEEWKQYHISHVQPTVVPAKSASAEAISDNSDYNDDDADKDEDEDEEEEEDQDEDEDEELDIVSVDPPSRTPSFGTSSRAPSFGTPSRAPSFDTEDTVNTSGQPM